MHAICCGAVPPAIPTPPRRCARPRTVPRRSEAVDYLERALLERAAGDDRAEIC